MKKNLFFLAAVPFVALLAGCPNGVEGEGEGDTGEGEGEGETFKATVALHFPIQPDQVLLDGEPIACTSLNCSVDITEKGEHCVIPTLSDHSYANPKCWTITESGNLEDSWDEAQDGPYPYDWTTDGQCGPTLSGAFHAQDGFQTSLQTLSTSQLVKLNIGFFEDYILIAETGPTCAGGGTNPDTGYRTEVTECEIADNRCGVAFHVSYFLADNTPDGEEDFALTANACP